MGKSLDELIRLLRDAIRHPLVLEAQNIVALSPEDATLIFNRLEQLRRYRETT